MLHLFGMFVGKQTDCCTVRFCERTERRPTPVGHSRKPTEANTHHLHFSKSRIKKGLPDPRVERDPRPRHSAKRQIPKESEWPPRHQTRTWRRCERSLRLQGTRCGPLKLHLTTLPQEDPGTLRLARDVYEAACKLCVARKDSAALDRQLVLLRPYVFEYRAVVGDSADRFVLIGLELLQLLVAARLGEFYSLLELVAIPERSNKFIAFVVDLERELMEGRYNNLLRARRDSPSQLYEWLLEQFESTVRDEIASCIEVAYPSLTMTELCRLLNLAVVEDVVAYASGREKWAIDGSTVAFLTEDPDHKLTKASIPSEQLIHEALNHAAELERII